MKDLKKLKKDLEHWIELNIGMDIVEYTFQREEYAPYVVIAFARKVPMNEIPENVVKQLEQAIKQQESMVRAEPKKNIFKRWLSCILN